MDKKKYIAGGVVIAVAAAIAGGLLITKNQEEQPEHQTVKQEVKKEKPAKIRHASKSDKQVKQSDISTEEENVQEVKDEKVKRAFMYENYPASMVPLSGITALTDLSPTANAAVSKIFDKSNNIYMINRSGHKLFMVVENPENIRHGVEFIELDTRNGHQTNTSLGYNSKMQDSDNETWEYDKNSEEQLPTRHAKYNKDGDVEFVEFWYYNNSPVKYEMRDGEGNVISIKKETLDNDTNMRVEHVVYDKSGKTKINVTAAFEGDDIKRFTYYNADKPAESASVFGDYEDGNKVQETVYTSDLKVKNVYKADYENGIRKDITVFDNKDNEIEKVLPITEE